MTPAQWLFLVFEVSCFSYCAWLFMMVGRNQSKPYQAHRNRLTRRLRLPDKDGLYDFFAVVLMVNVVRVLWPVFDA
jgi:hypothetical protein